MNLLRLYRTVTVAAALAALAATLAPSPALAAEDESKVERVVVRNRKHYARGKFEVNPGVGFSLTNRLTEHTNLELGLAYNFGESFALELRPGYAISGHTSVAEQVQTEVYAANPNAAGAGVAANPTPDDFADLWQLQWQALVLPRWQPIYGKLNLATELPIHFQMFLTAGGGAVGLTRESVVYCQNGGSRPAECSEYLTEDRVTFGVGGGGGFRFYASDWAMLKVEVFDLAFPDEYREKVDRAKAEGEAPGSTPAQGTAAGSPGFTNLIFINIGTSFQF